MASVDVLRDLWKRIDTPYSACPDVSFDRLLGAMCDILSLEGFGGGNTPLQCWILAYVSIVGRASLMGVQSLREQKVPFDVEDRFEAMDAISLEVEKELEDLYFRGFLTRDKGVYQIKP
jgi:hypothetical protein